jgi:hypothetical protein
MKGHKRKWSWPNSVQGTGDGWHSHCLGQDANLAPTKYEAMLNYFPSFYCSCPHYLTPNFLHDHAKNSFVSRTVQRYNM